MVDLWKDFWIRETGTGQQVAQLNEIYDDDDKLLYKTFYRIALIKKQVYAPTK